MPMQNGTIIIGILCVWNVDRIGRCPPCSGLISSTYFRLSNFRSSISIISSSQTRIAIAKLVSKSYEEMGRRTYKNVPVNYAIRVSGSVTALTARRIWHGVVRWGIMTETAFSNFPITNDQLPNNTYCLRLHH